VTVALPLLDAMVPALSALAKTAGDPVRRLGFVYIPMGSNIAQFTPKQVGRITELSPTLRPLTPVMDQITILTNMELQNAYPGTHATSNAAFLSAARAKRTESTDYSGTTVDRSRLRRSDRIRRCPARADGFVQPVGGRQRLRLHLQQFVLVIADDAAAVGRIRASFLSACSAKWQPPTGQRGPASQRVARSTDRRRDLSKDNLARTTATRSTNTLIRSAKWSPHSEGRE
jgi:hypothetical protein